MCIKVFVYSDCFSCLSFLLHFHFFPSLTLFPPFLSLPSLCFFLPFQHSIPFSPLSFLFIPFFPVQTNPSITSFLPPSPAFFLSHLYFPPYLSLLLSPLAHSSLPLSHVTTHSHSSLTPSHLSPPPCLWKKQQQSFFPEPTRVLNLFVVLDLLFSLFLLLCFVSVSCYSPGRVSRGISYCSGSQKKKKRINKVSP